MAKKIICIIVAAFVFLVPLSMTFGFHSEDIFTTTNGLLGVLNTIGERGKGVVNFVVNGFGTMYDGVENRYVLIGDVRYELHTNLYLLDGKKYYVTYGWQSDKFIGLTIPNTFNIVLYDTNILNAFSCKKNIITASLTLYNRQNEKILTLTSKDLVGTYPGTFTFWDY